MRDAFRAIVFVAMLSAVGFAQAQQHVTSGEEIDYQPAIIEASDGGRIAVFERLDASSFFGDLWITRSTDGGDTWSEAAAILATGANERHPALIETAPSRFTLFYLKGQSASSSFRIFRATSSDGAAFAEVGQIDLGWATGGEVNPHVIRHDDGTLTMSYQRYDAGSASYDCFVAESTDGGLTWDPLQTMIAPGAQLPRIAYRESDGLYLASYQIGSTGLHIYTKTTTNVHDWGPDRFNFAVVGDNHDSLPVVMPDGAFVTFFIRATGGTYDLAFRRSTDGTNWAPAIAGTNTLSVDDVEPHPLLVGSPDYVELYWGRDEPAGSFTYDIVREPIVPVNDIIFADGFEN